jgi:hypothetical protein
MRIDRLDRRPPTCDRYPPFVRGWLCLARSGRMQRGYRDVGYLLARRLRRLRPRWLGRRAWRYHLETLRECLARRDADLAMQWFSATYPGLVGLIPTEARPDFVAGVEELGRQECGRPAERID